MLEHERGTFKKVYIITEFNIVEIYSELYKFVKIIK